MADKLDQGVHRNTKIFSKPPPLPPVPDDQRFEDMYQANLPRVDAMANALRTPETGLPRSPHRCPPNFPSALRFLFPRRNLDIPTNGSPIPKLDAPIRLRDYNTGPRAASRNFATHAHSHAVDLRYLNSGGYDADGSSDSDNETDQLLSSPSPSRNVYSTHLRALRDRSASPRSRLSGISSIGPTLTPPRPTQGSNIPPAPVTPRRPTFALGKRYPGTRIRETIRGRSPRVRGMRILLSPPDSPIRSQSTSPTPPPPSPPVLGIDSEYDNLFRARMESLFGEQYGGERGLGSPLYPGIDREYDLHMIEGLRKLFNEPNWTPGWLQNYVYPSESEPDSQIPQTN